VSAPVIIGKAAHIYALCDESGCVRYVGKTVRRLSERLAQHKRAAKREGRLPVHRWMLKHEVAVTLLETVPAGADWAARERFWIGTHSNLLNLTTGGEGLCGLTFMPEHRQKIADALKTGAYLSCAKCGGEFWRKRSAIEQGRARFCSRECYQIWQRGQSKNVPTENTASAMRAAQMKRQQQTHCKRGHLLSGENLFLTWMGARGCKQCRKLHKATYRGRSANA